jgi:capsular polysaccharide biosynthesis protein
VERDVKSTQGKPVEAAMVARAAFGSLLIAAPAALIVALVSLAFLLRGPTYAPSALLEVDQGHEARHSGLSVPVPRPRAPFHLVRTIEDDRAIAKEAIRRSGSGVSSEELLENSTARHPRGTNRIRITYEGTDRKEATRLVNTLAEVASERISETSVAGKNLEATVHEQAKVPRPIPDPKPLRNGLLTLVAVWTLCSGGTLVLVAVLRR